MLDSVAYFGFKILCYNKLVYFFLREGERSVKLLLSLQINNLFIITTAIYIIFHHIIFNKLKTDISSTK